MFITIMENSTCDKVIPTQGNSDLSQTNGILISTPRRRAPPPQVFIYFLSNVKNWWLVSLSLVLKVSGI